jgi:sirohydrochlorin cobaltochelatase
MHATILFGHGSRDPAWREPMDRLAARITALEPSHRVCCAFLEISQPDLLSVAAELANAGVSHCTIMPMFLGVGRHAREDLPLLLKQIEQAHPSLQIKLRPFVGEEPAVINLLASLALDGFTSAAQAIP